MWLGDTSRTEREPVCRRRTRISVTVRSRAERVRAATPPRPAAAILQVAVVPAATTEADEAGQGTNAPADSRDSEKNDDDGSSSTVRESGQNQHSGKCLARVLSAKAKQSSRYDDCFTRERRGGDSNPRYLAVRWFSRPVHSATLAPLQVLQAKGVTDFRYGHSGGVATPDACGSDCSWRASQSNGWRL